MIVLTSLSVGDSFHFCFQILYNFILLTTPMLARIYFNDTFIPAFHVYNVLYIITLVIITYNGSG
jgi:hypothetical protein